MRRCGWTRSVRGRLALAAGLAIGATAWAAERPHYGGTLRVLLRQPATSLDPADSTGGALRDRMFALIGDRLVMLDDGGRPRPMLAVAWQQEGEGAVWQFRLRPGVLFHDGSRLDAAAIAAILEPVLKGAAISASGLTVSIQFARPAPNLPAILAEARASIVRRGPDGGLDGTGPFRLTRWEPGQRATLAANEDYWAGRPFLDQIEIGMARPARELIADFELGRADLVEMGPADLRRVESQQGRRLWVSPAMDLLALKFVAGRGDDPRMREAVGLAIDRQSIFNVLLQRQGEVFASLLPQCVSGYAFLFPPTADFAKARQWASLVAQPDRAMTIAYDPSDPLARAVADRVSVNARDAGLLLQPAARGATPDVELVRYRIASSDPPTALVELAAVLGLALPEASGVNGWYAAERDMLEGRRIIPLAHVPEIFGVGARVRNWAPAIRQWHLENVWLEPRS